MVSFFQKHDGEGFLWRHGLASLLNVGNGAFSRCRCVALEGCVDRNPSLVGCIFSSSRFAGNMQYPLLLFPFAFELVVRESDSCRLRAVHPRQAGRRSGGNSRPAPLRSRTTDMFGGDAPNRGKEKVAPGRRDRRGRSKARPYLTRFEQIEPPSPVSFRLDSHTRYCCRQSHPASPPAAPRPRAARAARASFRR